MNRELIKIDQEKTNNYFTKKLKFIPRPEYISYMAYN